MARTVKKGWIGKIQVMNSNREGVQVNENGFFAIAGRPTFAIDDKAAVVILVTVYKSKAQYKSGLPALNPFPFEYRITNDILVDNGEGGTVGLFDKYFGTEVPGKDFDNAVLLLSSLTGEEAWNSNNINFVVMTDAGT